MARRGDPAGFFVARWSSRGYRQAAGARYHLW